MGKTWLAFKSNADGSVSKDIGNRAVQVPRHHDPYFQQDSVTRNGHPCVQTGGRIPPAQLLEPEKALLPMSAMLKVILILETY